MRVALTKRSALVIVDVQNDFLPGGALAVPNGDRIIEPLNRYIVLFNALGLPIFATRDWHPANHISFKDRGGPWPPHCVQNTWGAQISEKLNLPKNARVVDKAFSPDRDAYSAFQDTSLALELYRLNVKRLFIGGLATEYCVKSTVLDALDLGFEVLLLMDAIKGIDVNVGDSERAIKEMILKGAIGVTIDEVIV